MFLAEEITLAITAAAISISKRLSPEDAALLGAAFTQLGDTLATIAAARDRFEQLEEASQADQLEETSQSSQNEQVVDDA